MSQEIYKVSANGQVTLPAPLRNSWHLQQGGYMSIADAKDAILMLPKNHNFALVEAVFPQSELRKRAEAVFGGGYPQEIKEPSFSKQHKVSSSGQFVLSKPIRDRWNITDNGFLDVIDLGNAAIVQPETANADLESCIPMDVMLGDWQDQLEPELLPYYPQSYHAWCADMGSDYRSYASGVSSVEPHVLELNDASITVLGQRIGQSVLQAAFTHAAH